MRQDDRYLDWISLPQTAVTLPGTGLVAGGDWSTDWGLSKHSHWGPKAGAGQGGDILLTGP